MSGIGRTCEMNRQIDPKRRYSSRETRPWQCSRFQETRRYVHLLFMTGDKGLAGSLVVSATRMKSLWHAYHDAKKWRCLCNLAVLIKELGYDRFRIFQQTGIINLLKLRYANNIHFHVTPRWKSLTRSSV